MKRGVFIVIEGVDRSGKTSQCHRIVERLNTEGITAKFYGFPNRTTQIGQQINKYLQNATEIENHCVHLLFSANRWELSKSILDDLKNGVNIICDRYIASGVAYSVTRGLDMEWCIHSDKGLPAPDVTFQLELPIEEQMRRAGFGEERLETREFQQSVAEAFRRLSSEFYPYMWTPVSALGSIDEVHERLYGLVKNAISECCTHPYQYFSLVCRTLQENKRNHDIHLEEPIQPRKLNKSACPPH